MVVQREQRGNPQGSRIRALRAQLSTTSGSRAALATRFAPSTWLVGRGPNRSNPSVAAVDRPVAATTRSGESKNLMSAPAAPPWQARPPAARKPAASAADENVVAGQPRWCCRPALRGDVLRREGIPAGTRPTRLLAANGGQECSPKGPQLRALRGAVARHGMSGVQCDAWHWATRLFPPSAMRRSPAFCFQLPYNL